MHDGIAQASGLTLMQIASVRLWCWWRSVAMIVFALHVHGAAFAQVPDKGCLSPDTIDCTPKRTCTLLSDDRNCNLCAIMFAGSCHLRVHDPACERTKEAQNVLFARQKVECERQKKVEEAECTSLKNKVALAFAACSKGE
jgi:hypothetical protein